VLDLLLNFFVKHDDSLFHYSHVDEFSKSKGAISFGDSFTSVVLLFRAQKTILTNDVWNGSLYNLIFYFGSTAPVLVAVIN